MSLGAILGGMDTKRCSTCRIDLPRANFSRMAAAKDGLCSRCKDCNAVYQRSWRRKQPDLKERTRRSLKAYVARNPDRTAARRAVKYRVRTQQMPPAVTLPCVDCAAPAHHYDHHLGYDKAHQLDVQPVCRRCHGLRSRARGEHARPN